MNNAKIKDLLTSAVKYQKIVNGYIFSETGKCESYKYAKEFAKMILCLENGEGYCKKCKSCLMFEDENHSDFYEISKKKAESITIDEIREMQTKIIEKPIISSKKVYIINNSENMTKEAQNCLLKTLEEPPEFVTIIFVTNNENKMLTTIKSRCTKVLFTEENKNELTEEEKIRYDTLERIFGNIEKYISIDLIGKIDVLYKDKENIFENLEFINIILNKKAKFNYKYLDYIDYVEETKKKLIASSNLDMSLDNLILRIWE